MNDVMKKLEGKGCDISGAMERFLNDEDFYMSCLQRVVHDESFDKLKAALENHSIQEAFDAAHTLKGVLANMGLTPMYDTVVKIVEPLRAGTDEGLMPYYDVLIKQNEELKSFIQ